MEPIGLTTDQSGREQGEGGEGVADARDVLLHLAWKGCQGSGSENNFVVELDRYINCDSPIEAECSWTRLVPAFGYPCLCDCHTVRMERVARKYR